MFYLIKKIFIVYRTQTDTGELVEDTMVIEITILKELCKLIL